MSKLVFATGEWLIEVGEAGDVLVRQGGSPLAHHGFVFNQEVSTVSAWRARVPASRYVALAAGFAEARAMKDCDWSFIPDERGATLALGASIIPVGQRALASNIALDRVVAEL